jgi:hypothetical protein
MRNIAWAEKPSPVYLPSEIRQYSPVADLEVTKLKQKYPINQSDVMMYSTLKNPGLVL